MIHLLLAVTMIDLPRYLPLKTSSVYFPSTLFIDSHWWMANLSYPHSMQDENLPAAERDTAEPHPDPPSQGQDFNIHTEPDTALKSPEKNM